MRSPKIKISFTGFSDSDLLTRATHIVVSMTNNPDFVDPVPSIVEVQAALAAYAQALTSAEGLGRNNVVVKNQARATLEQLLAQLGRWVMYVANGNLTVLTASGYPLAKDPQPRHLDNPGNVILRNGITSGTMSSLVKRRNGSSFVHEISGTLPSENTVWDKFPTNSSQFVFTGLTPGKQYWVKVAAIGYRNQIAYSTVASQFAQ